MIHKRTVLGNGLRVVTIPMPGIESATVMVMVGAGSRYESKKNNGISHFLEHMAFKGTKKRPSAMAIASLIDSLGGENNAFTGKETTAYYIKTQATHLNTSLDILSDMLQNSLFDPTEIEKEKGVIIEEINMYEDTPMRKLGDIYEQLLYGDTPMGWDIAGTKEVIRSVDRDYFTSYMQSLYSADNMTVVVAGGVDPKKVEQLVEEYFGQMPQFATVKPSHVEENTENQQKPATLIRPKKTEQTHIAIGVRTIPLEHEDRYALDVLAAIMGGGMSSRLFHEVREKRGLAYYVRTNSDNYTDVGTLVTAAGVDPARVEKAVKVIVEQHAQLRKPGNITDEELHRAKELLKGHFVLDLEDSRSVASFYAHQEILESHIEDPTDILRRVDEVKMDDIERVTKKYIVDSTLNLAAIGNIQDGQNFENLLQLQ